MIHGVRLRWAGTGGSGCCAGDGCARGGLDVNLRPLDPQSATGVIPDAPGAPAVGLPLESVLRRLVQG